MGIQIDWQVFTPISLVGGLILGVATVILLLGIGRIAGISGIFSSLLKPKRVEMWQVLFILGLVISPLLYQLARPLPEVAISTSVPLLIGAGLFVYCCLVHIFGAARWEDLKVLSRRSGSDLGGS